MSEKQSFPPIDLSAIPFPSDKLTLGQVRKLDHSVNGADVFSSSAALSDARATDIYSIIPIRNEMMLAEKAYAAFLGLPEPSPLVSRADVVRNLRTQWQEDGISSGPHLSTQFIRDIEQAAVRQAQQNLGTGR